LSHELHVDDLTALWRAGAVLLPTVAIQYATLARELHKTALNEGPGFSRTEGGMGPLHAVWTGLRDTMQDRVAVKSYDNLVRAGNALKAIAESYATTDHLSADQLAQFNTEIENADNDPVFEPPAYVPDAPTTTEPHPEEAPPGPPGY
jgi:hypothetical protein